MMRRLSILLACVVMALTLIALTVASGASAAPKQQPPPNHFYGALDVSRAKLSQGAPIFGWYKTGASKASANRAAYNSCRSSGATDCQTRVWVYNGWIALAQSNEWTAFGWGRTERKALNTAVKNCRLGTASVGGGSACLPGGTAQTALDPNKKTTGGYTLPGP
jgi:hypothetical protein